MSVQAEIEALFQDLRTHDRTRLPEIAPKIETLVLSNQENLDVQYLIDLLSDPKFTVRYEAAHLLGILGSKLATPALIQVMRADSEKEVRSRAAEALGQIGDVSALNDLKELLERIPQKRGDNLVYAYVAGAIAELDDKSVPEILVGALVRSYQDWDGELWNMRELIAMDDLVAIGSERVGELLLAQFDHIDTIGLEPNLAYLKVISTQCLMIYTWGKIRYEKALGKIIHCLSHREENLRGAAATALGDFGKPEFIPLLTDALENETDDIARRDIVKSINQIERGMPRS